MSQLAPESQDFVKQIQDLLKDAPAPPAAAGPPHRQDRGVRRHRASGKLAPIARTDAGRRPVRHHTGPAPEGVGPVARR